MEYGEATFNVHKNDHIETEIVHYINGHKQGDHSKVNLSHIMVGHWKEWSRLNAGNADLSLANDTINVKSAWWERILFFAKGFYNASILTFK